MSCGVLRRGRRQKWRSDYVHHGERVVARLTGVEQPDGSSWEVSVDTVGYPVTICGSTAGVTASVPETVIGFKQAARGRSLPIVRCAVTFTATVTPAS